MTQQTISLGGEGGNAFPFNTPGDSVTGKIMSGEDVQQTDMVTGQPSFWPDGRPKMMTRVTLQTQLHDDDSDDGQRSVYLRGSVKSESRSSIAAVRDAAKAATGSYDIAIGGTLTLSYIGDGEPTQRGFNPPKLYSARYQPPTMSLGGQQAPAPVQQQAPAPMQQQTNGSSIGSINGKPVDAAMIAAYENIGIDVRTLPQFVPADQPPF